MVSVLQDWVMNLGLRHQGVLVSAIRGGDTNPKEDPLKDLLRCYRNVILNSFDEHPSSFIEKVDIVIVEDRMRKVLDSFDHYPMHFLLHVIYGSEIIGYKCPDDNTRILWNWFYRDFVHRIHLNPETEEEMDKRLLANEREFAEHKSRCNYH